MGSSCVSNRKSMSSRKSRDFSEYPDDLNSYNQARRSSLQKHKFQGVLYNIAIINYPKSGVSLKFSIDEIVEVMLPKKFKTKDSQDIKWVIKEKFTFLADQYELRLKFLTVKLTDEQGKIKQILKINLFKIATGPYHNDFQIKGDTRIKFDFKVSQYVELKINCKQTKAELNKKQYPGESFHFTIRVLKEENQQPFESNPSYIQTSPYLKSQKIDKVSSQYDQCPSPIKIRNKVPVKSFQPKCSFTWSSDNGQMPNFRILVKSNKIENTVLHLVIWRAENQVETQDTNQADQNADMFCEAFTHFTQILQKEAISKKASNTNQYIQQRVLFLQKQGLWSDGQKIGQYSIKMVVENNTFIKQMKACTRTQQGIIESTPLFSATVGAQSKQHKVAKFAQIQQMMQKIQSLNKQINQNKKLSYLSSQKLKEEMIGEFQKIRKFFQSDLQNSFYVPTTQQQGLKLIDEQKLLMSVLSRVISYAQDDDTLTEVCWRVANVIARRGQFQLCNIGFNKNDQAEMKKSISPFYQKKLKTALDFQELQYKLLLQSLRIGYIEGRQDPRQAVEMFRAYAYFRVPCYREIILRKVVRKEDLSIQWNTSITDEQIESMPEAQTILSSQLDWQNNFYKPLQIESKSEVLTKQMIENLEGSLWLQQISKRGSTFFYFLYFLISKLSELGKRIKFIKWQYFPGYNKLVRAFLFQMRNIKVDRYPQSMIQTSIYLLANEKLLNILVSMIFEKTNVHDHNGLMKGLDIISRYLNHFTKNNKMLPPSFNYVYFFKGIKAILQGQFAYAMVKILSIIFMNFDNFNVEFKKSLSFYLLGRVFFKLFLNWSFTTRKAFYHVLILKIQRTNIFDAESRKQFSNKHQIMNSISTRYQESMKIVKNAYQVSKSENHNRFLRNQNKQLFKHLKKKIALKRKKADNKYSANNNDIENLMIKRSSNPIDYKNSIDSPVKLQNKYSLRELTKTSSTQRSFSVMLDPNIINFALQNYKKNDKNVEEKAQTRTRSGTAYIDTGDEQGQMSGTKPKKIKQRRRSIYGMDEFEMRQMDKKQIRYLQTSLKQFQDLDQAIRKYYMAYSELPICELDVEVPIDEKQIKPSSADFEQWQATQNSQLDMN